MKKLPIILILALIALSGWFVFARNNSPDSSGKDKESSQKTGFNKEQHSLSDPTSLWVIANKQRPLNPKTYKPSDLRAPNVPLRLTAGYDEMQMRDAAASAIEGMFALAKRDGVELMVSSAFRSYDYQEGLYNGYVKNQGQATADTQSARPGYSEHQTGWAIDVEPSSRNCEVEECFADTPEGKWVAANAYKFGFVIRYHEGKQDTTGYIYEPWHLRFVGTELAGEVNKQGNPTLEEFFGLPPAPDYR
jgi:D-alanyl-D-alanine carboxypeptidase